VVRDATDAAIAREPAQPSQAAAAAQSVVASLEAAVPKRKRPDLLSRCRPGRPSHL